jgi:hypothetical protein
MKTAMQELIDWINQYEGEMIAADQVALKAYRLVEEEKEQICRAFNNLTICTPEQYYNKTYNQNK